MQLVNNKTSIEVIETQRISMDLSMHRTDIGPIPSPHKNNILIVTGGIGSGKSYIIQHLKEKGFHTFDSDGVIRELLQPDGGAYTQVSHLAPEALIHGVIDRPTLAKIAFNNYDLLQELENILYPLLQHHRANWINGITTGSIALEIPLFFEKKVAVKHDLVLAAICDVELQIKRALARGKMDIHTIKQIIANQVNNQHRISCADIVINTNGSQLDTIKQLSIIHNIN